MECLNLKGVSLFDHQKIPSYFILNPLNRGLLVFYGLGTGKTLTSIAMLNCLLTKYPTKTATVLTPASLISNYTKELERLNLEPSVFSRIKIYSYLKFINKINKLHLTSTPNDILVIDESQNFLSQSSIRYKTIFDYSKGASKVILLSATILRNNVEEIATELSLLNGYKVSGGAIAKINEEPDIETRKKELKKVLHCKIAYYVKDVENENYPQRIDHNVKLKMGALYYKKYYEIEKNVSKELHTTFSNTSDLQRFYNGVRRASNIVTHDLGSPKITWAINKIKYDLQKNKKVLVYSNWISAGIDLLKHELNGLGINYSLVVGSMSRKEKDLSIQNYNTDKTNVIVISTSGAEGINLKNTRSVIILEKNWNNSKLEQVIGRAIRLNSHKTLPVLLRKVDIYNLILVKPDIRHALDHNKKSADELLFDLSTNKDRVIKKFYDNIKSLSVTYDKSCF
jgi:SNF2 family DNA or RNA helicase